MNVNSNDKTDKTGKTRTKDGATKTTARRPAARKASAASVEIPREEIALEAYLLFEARGGHDGDPESDWLEAERRLRERRQAAPRARRAARPRTVR